MNVLGSLTALRDDLAPDAGQHRKYESVILKRGGRVLLERIWEDPRRRYETGDRFRRKAAGGAVGTRGARTAGKDLVLEHVVPAKVVVDLLLASQGREPESVARMLRQVVTHVVAHPKDFQKGFPKDMDAVQVSKLHGHFLGGDLLDEDELLAVRWSRYLDHPSLSPICDLVIGPAPTDDEVTQVR